MVWWLIWTLVSVAAVVTVGISIGVVNARLKTRRTVAVNAREGLEFQLKRRHELIDAMMLPIQGDGSFDLGSSDNVSFLARRARHTIEFSEREHFETALADSLKELLEVVDNSPELPVAESYAKPRQLFAEAETDLQNAQRFYNDSVQQYNAIIDLWPNRLVAALFSFEREETFEVGTVISEPKPIVVGTHQKSVPTPKSIQRSAETKSRPSK